MPEPSKRTPETSESATQNTDDLSIRFDERIDGIDDFDDRFVISRPNRPDRPGRQLRDEPAQYLAVGRDDLDEFVDEPDVEVEDCSRCQKAESGQQRRANDRLQLLTPRRKLGYDLRCRTCGALLTQIGYVPVAGIVVPEDDVSIPEDE